MIVQNILNMLVKYNMTGENNTLYVGFSGGADSTALLLALRDLSNTMHFTVKAIHVNHMLRGDESDRDEQFCVDLCAKYGIEIYTEHVNVNEHSKMYNKSVEESARILRYNAFEKLCHDGKICTAHNLNDNAETILFNMTRGTGLKGICGIPVKRGNIIRPLLNSSREDIEKYLARKGQDFVTDSTNLSDDYTRNKIRHNVVPVLTEINGGFLNCIRNMTDILNDDEDYLDKSAEDVIGDDLREVHSAVRKRAIMKILKPYGFEVSSYMVLRIESALKSESLVKINVHKNCYAYIKNGKVKVQVNADNSDNERKVFKPVLTKIGENSFFSDKKVMVFVNNGEIITNVTNIHEILTKEVLDCDTIQGDIVLRNRRDGDAYVRCGRDFKSSLKKLFNDKKIPSHERDNYAVLEDENGIIWVEGFGIADRCKISDNTTKFLEVSVITKCDN